MSNKKRYKSNYERFGLLSVLPGVLALAMSGVLVVSGAFLIMLKGGPWLIPLFLCYLALVMMPVSLWVGKRDKNNLRFTIGDEPYFTEYPEERKKALGRARRLGTKPETGEVIERIQCSPLPFFPEKNEGFEKKKRRGRICFMAAALLLAAMGAFLLFRAWQLYQNALAAPRKQLDLTPLFPLLGGTLVLITAVLAFLRKKNRLLQTVTVLVLLIGAWGTSISVSVKKSIIWQDVLISFGCALVYGLLCWILLKRAEDLRSQEQQFADYRQLQLDLFELGCIPEDTLEMRLEIKQRAMS